MANLPDFSAVVPSLLAAHAHTVSFHFNWSVRAALAILAGILILIRPKVAHVIIAIYLIVIGTMLLLDLTW